MSTLEIRLRDLTTRVGTEFKSIRAIIGNPAQLTTTQKATLVAALNGLQTDVSSLQTAMQTAGINDGVTASNSTWSSVKINTKITAAIDALLGGVDGRYDTLVELAAALDAANGQLDGLLTMLNNRVRFDAPQTLTAPQQAQARANIGVGASVDLGNTDRDLVADLEAALI